MGKQYFLRFKTGTLKNDFQLPSKTFACSYVLHTINRKLGHFAEIAVFTFLSITPANANLSNMFWTLLPSLSGFFPSLGAFDDGSHTRFYP